MLPPTDTFSASQSISSHTITHKWFECHEPSEPALIPPGTYCAKALFMEQIFNVNASTDLLCGYPSMATAFCSLTGPVSVEDRGPTLPGPILLQALGVAVARENSNLCAVQL